MQGKCPTRSVTPSNTDDISAVPLVGGIVGAARTRTGVKDPCADRQGLDLGYVVVPGTITLVIDRTAEPRHTDGAHELYHPGFCFGVMGLQACRIGDDTDQFPMHVAQTTLVAVAYPHQIPNHRLVGHTWFVHQAGVEERL